MKIIPFDLNAFHILLFNCPFSNPVMEPCFLSILIYLEIITYSRMIRNCKCLETLRSECAKIIRCLVWSAKLITGAEYSVLLRWLQKNPNPIIQTWWTLDCFWLLHPKTRFCSFYHQSCQPLKLVKITLNVLNYKTSKIYEAFQPHREFL